MKKYKLIKEYPGSPKLGTISYNEGVKTVFEYTKSMYSFTSSLIHEEYPEFWKLVVEKEYEILSFKGRASDLIYYLVNNHYCLKECTTGNPLEYNLKSQLYDIHSIKRLSDGEVFTVGDLVHHKKWDSIGTIQRFRLLDSFIFIWIDWNIKNNVCDDSEAILKDIEHYVVKQPLFKTEDGVDIHEDETYFFIHNWVIKSAVAKTGSFYHAIPGYYWSTKEAAEEYIINYKPCLSLLDVEGYLDAHQLTMMKNLIKSRL